MKSLTTYITESLVDKALSRDVRRAITRGGGKIYQIGGAVRDDMLGKVSKDLDLLVTGVDLKDLEKRLKPFGKVDVVGVSFGIIKFKPTGTDEYLDISVPRIDSKSTGKGHKDFEVKLGKGITLQQDQMRRDFWMNAIAKDIETGEVHDIEGQGKLDIETRQVRMINPKAFQDDPLRMLRAVQFAARFNFDIEEKTLKEISNNAKLVTTVAAERVQEELRKLFEKSKSVAKGFNYLYWTGMFDKLFPKGGRRFDTGTMNKLDKSAFPAFVALMLYNYGNAAGDTAKTTMKLSNDDADAVDGVVEYILMTTVMNDFQLVQFALKKSEHTMHNIDAFVIASKGKRDSLLGKLNSMRRKGLPTNLGELGINGRDLTSLGIKGTKVGDALEHLLKFAIDTGNNDRDSLLAEIKREYRITEKENKMVNDFIKQHLETELTERAGGFVKGWTKKNKIVVSTGDYEYYHIMQVIKEPRKFGLDKKKILKLLEDVYDSWSAPNPKAEAQQTYNAIESGEMDKQEDIEAYLSGKDYCRFVIDAKHGSIKSKDEKTGRESAQLLDDNYLPFERDGFKLFEIRPTRGRDKYITSKFDWYNWLAGKAERKYVSKMAQFREWYDLGESTNIVCGDCMKWAIDWNIDHMKKDRSEKHKVVHGLVTNYKGKTFPHAWIEDKGKVYDTNMPDKGIRVKRFYDLLNVRDTVEYTPTEATRALFKYGHYGPWDKSFDKWPTTKT